MSSENVEIVRQIYARLGGEDMVALVRDHRDALRAGLEAVYAPDIEVRWISSNPEAGAYRGHAGYMQALEDWLGAWEEFYVEAEDFIEAGEQVAVPTRQRAIGRSGLRTEERATFLYTLREGKVARIREFATTEEALEAAGLPGHPFGGQA